MRWSCPHCGTWLQCSADRVGPSWTFARCTQCGGFGLVRRAQVEVVRVETAPAGESYIESQRVSTPVVAPPQGSPLPPARAARAENPGPIQPYSNHHGVMAPAQRGIARALPWIIGGTCLLAIASGTFVYLQGDQLLKVASQQQQLPPQQAVAMVAQQNAPAVSAIDQVSHQAMAPLRETSQLKEAPRPDAQSALSSNLGSQTTLQTEPATTTIPEAPLPKVEEARQLTIQILETPTNLRSGPGLNYPVIGTVRKGERLSVLDWQDQWFKIHAGTRSAWVKKTTASLVLEN